MPFTRTTTPPKTDAKITVEVTGLMLLREGANNTCEIGIHRFSRDHLFQACLIVKKADRPPRLIRLQTGLPTSDFTMTLVPTTAVVGIQAFAPTPDADFHRDPRVDDNRDYRWAFNVRKLPNHDTVDFPAGAHPRAQPLATLNSGVLYTSNLSRDGQSIMQICGGNSINLNRVAADLAFAIDLPGDLSQPGSPRLEIEWSDRGESQHLELPRPGEEGEDGPTYTLSLINDPPFINPEAHEELDRYYKVLERNGASVPELERCALQIGDAPTSDQIPCLSILLEGP